MIYPTALRAKGTGAAVAVQKVGAIAGPVLGGILLSAQISVRHLFYLGAIPLVLVALLTFFLGRLQRASQDQIAAGMSNNCGPGAAHVA